MKKDIDWSVSGDTPTFSEKGETQQAHSAEGSLCSTWRIWTTKADINIPLLKGTNTQ